MSKCLITNCNRRAPANEALCKKHRDNTVLRPSIITNIAESAIDDILDKGLADSTFREKYPEAYEELLHYRDDMVVSVEMSVIKETTPK